MPEVVVCGCVFVMVTEGDRGYNQVHAVFLHPVCLDHTIVIDRGEMLSFDVHSINPHAPGQFLKNGRTRQAMLFDDAGHTLLQVIMLFPFLL